MGPPSLTDRAGFRKEAWIWGTETIPVASAVTKVLRFGRIGMETVYVSSRQRAINRFKAITRYPENMAGLIGITFRDAQKAKPYEDALHAVHLTPVAITPEWPRSLDGLDGLLLTGGTDLNPRLYGESADKHALPPDDERDKMEIDLLHAALKTNLPVLAICRGMQLFQVALGGKLIQHLESSAIHVQKPDHHATAARHPSAHTIRVEKGTKLAEIIGVGEHDVNSRHHQAVKGCAGGLRVSARSADGTIEAMELPTKRFAVAVQWHPEDRIGISEADRRLFRAFAEATRHPVPRKEETTATAESASETVLCD